MYEDYRKLIGRDKRLPNLDTEEDWKLFIRSVDQSISNQMDAVRKARKRQLSRPDKAQQTFIYMLTLQLCEMVRFRRQLAYRQEYRRD